jgi:positive regulator of sigma E activity
MIKNYCAGSETKEKEIIVKCNDTDKYKIGEEVYVSIDEQQAFKSILLAYVIPLILTILTIISVISYTNNEIIGGISGIIILIPYYFGLFLAKDKLKSGFEFRISKKDA